jgi:Uma2 family endonuclease
MAEALRYPSGEMMSANPTRKLFNVHEYHQMGEAGILSARDRVELINGEILIKPMMGPPHCASVDRVSLAMHRESDNHYIVRTQGAVRLDQWSEPEPDVVLLRPKDDFYASKHPVPSDILLIVKVADSSLRFDAGPKARLYAKTGIPEYWIVDIPNDCLRVYSDVLHGAYHTVRQFRRGDMISPMLLPDCSLVIDTLLP